MFVSSTVDLAALKDDGVGAAALQLILQPADDGGVASRAGIARPHVDLSFHCGIGAVGVESGGHDVGLGRCGVPFVGASSAAGGGQQYYSGS